MIHDPAAALAKAISEKSLVSIVTPEGSERPVEAHFIGPARPGDPGAFWVQPAAWAVNTVKAWAGARARISVRFKVDGIGAGCETMALKHVTDYRLPNLPVIPALLVTEPTKLWLDQRGSARHLLQTDGTLRAKLSRRAPSTAPGARPAARPEPGLESRATLRDLGQGGAGFIGPVGRPQTLEGVLFEVTLQVAAKQAVFPVRMVYAQPQGSLLRIGVEFDRAAESAETNRFFKAAWADLEARTARLERRSA